MSTLSLSPQLAPQPWAVQPSALKRGLPVLYLRLLEQRGLARPRGVRMLARPLWPRLWARHAVLVSLPCLPGLSWSLLSETTGGALHPDWRLRRSVSALHLLGSWSPLEGDPESILRAEGSLVMCWSVAAAEEESMLRT